VQLGYDTLTLPQGSFVPPHQFVKRGLGILRISARVTNSESQHRVIVATNGAERNLAIPPKDSGRGSSVNGGEFLLAALATCVCNDLYREAGKRGINLDVVDVAAAAVFPAEGAPAERLEYHVTISGEAEDSVLRDLVRATDAVAEIHNTVRAAIPIELRGINVVENQI
jgi:uncharacterized OsmC-like protein